MEGRSLETPGEAVRPAGRTAWIGTRRESRRQGQEGRARMLTHVAHPDRKDLEGPDAPQRLQRPRAASKVEEGSGEANSRGIDRGSPPVERPPKARASGAKPHRRVRAQCPSEKGVVISQRPWPLGEGRGAERSATPLKTRRTTYPPAFCTDRSAARRGGRRKEAPGAPSGAPYRSFA